MPLTKRHSILGLLPLMQHLTEKGHSAEELLARWGMDLDHLSGSATLTLAQELQIIEAAIKLADDPLLGLKVGGAVSLSSYGTFAMLLLSAENLAEAGKASAQFQGLTYAFCDISHHLQAGYLEIRLNPPPISGALHDFVVDRDLAGSIALIKEIAPDIVPALKVGLAHRQPMARHLDDYRRYLGNAIEFDQPYGWIRCPISLLSRPMRHANPVAHQLYKAQCQVLMDSLCPEQETLSEQILRILTGYSGHFPTIEEVARTLALSERTLRRRLGEAGTSYRALLDQHRQQQAKALLTVQRLPVNQVASQLGYADTVSFLNAFRRWTGTTPRQYLSSRC